MHHEKYVDMTTDKLYMTESCVNALVMNALDIKAIKRRLIDPCDNYKSIGLCISPLTEFKVHNINMHTDLYV